MRNLYESLFNVAKISLVLIRTHSLLYWTSAIFNQVSVTVTITLTYVAVCMGNAWALVPMLPHTPVSVKTTLPGTNVVLRYVQGRHHHRQQRRQRHHIERESFQLGQSKDRLKQTPAFLVSVVATEIMVLYVPDVVFLLERTDTPYQDSINTIRQQSKPHKSDCSYITGAVVIVQVAFWKKRPSCCWSQW